MDSRMQAPLWAFVTRFKAQTGETLSYVRLAQEPGYLSWAVQRAQGMTDPDLRRQAAELAALLPERAQRSGADDQSEGAPAGAEDEARAEYQSQVQAALEHQAPVGLEEREALDALAKRLRLTAEAAEAAEEAARRALELPRYRWSDELRANVRRLWASGRLDERRRIQLYDLYIKRGRLSVTHAEQIMEQERPEEETAEPARPRGRLPWVLGGVAGALTAGLVAFGWFNTTPLEADSRRPASAAPVTVSGSIGRDTVWSEGGSYRLDGLVFVEAGATLTIEPGVTVQGGYGSALVVTPSARLHARGRPDAPVVFTSAQAAGERHAGDWGGLVLLGNAPVNRADAQVEGLAPGDPRARFGSDDSQHSCGVLEFARIEFAGHELTANNELNGLTLGGCGAGTIIRNVQVHQGLDDGVEVFGGNVDLRRVLVSAPGDDGLDWDLGWHGRVQQLVVLMQAGRGDNAIEADNNADDPNAMPRSMPVLHNVTLLAPGGSDAGQRGMTLRRGTGAVFDKLLLAGFSATAVDIQGSVSAALAGGPMLRFERTALYPAAAGGPLFAQEQGSGDDDAGLDEASLFAAGAWRTAILSSLGLNTTILPDQPPDLVPLPLESLSTEDSGIPEAEFWDASTDYIGAVRPGATQSWLEGWTAFPLD